MLLPILDVAICCHDLIMKQVGLILSLLGVMLDGLVVIVPTFGEAIIFSELLVLQNEVLKVLLDVGHVA
jgi:hypothetical protein